MRGIRGQVLSGAYSPYPPPSLPSPIATSGTYAAWDLLPGGHQVKGANLACRYSGGNLLGWANMWTNWEWDTGGARGSAGNWMKWQIDQAKLFGCNTVRTFGTFSARPGSGSHNSVHIDTPTYLAQWDQFFNYLRSQSMYAYPCVGGDCYLSYSPYDFTPTQEWLEAEYALVIASWARHQDIIIGVDLMNEGHVLWGYPDFANTLYATAKSAAPALKFTYSRDTAQTPLAGITTDFNDFHLYSNQAATVFRTALQANKPVLMGEFGAPMSTGTGGRQTAYNAGLAQVQDVYTGGTSPSPARIAGALAWEIADHDVVTSDEWGLCDVSGNVRSDVSTIFTGFPS